MEIGIRKIRKYLKGKKTKFSIFFLHFIYQVYHNYCKFFFFPLLFYLCAFKILAKIEIKKIF